MHLGGRRVGGLAAAGATGADRRGCGGRGCQSAARAGSQAYSSGTRRNGPPLAGRSGSRPRYAANTGQPASLSEFVSSGYSLRIPSRHLQRAEARAAPSFGPTRIPRHSRRRSPTAELPTHSQPLMGATSPRARPAGWLGRCGFGNGDDQGHLAAAIGVDPWRCPYLQRAGNSAHEAEGPSGPGGKQPAAVGGRGQKSLPGSRALSPEVPWLRLARL